MFACSIPASERALIDELKNYFLSNVFGSNLILISPPFNPLQLLNGVGLGFNRFRIKTENTSSIMTILVTALGFL